MTLDEVRARMKAAGIEIAEDRLEMVRKLLTDALAPIHAFDSSAARRLEPGVMFDAVRSAEPPDDVAVRAAAAGEASL